MDFYKDFDSDNENSDTVLARSSNKTKESNPEVKKNTFIFESFSDRMKKIKIRLSDNFENDVSFIQLEQKDKIKFSENKSNFVLMLEREKVLNLCPEFVQFCIELQPYIASFLLIVNNSTKIFKIISDTLHTQIDCNEGETQHIQVNYPFVLSVLEVMLGLIKDIREDAYELFLTHVLGHLTKLVLKTDKPEVIDKIFSLFVNVFKFLYKSIEKNFDKFFIIYSELIFSRNKFIRKFASQSICYVLKNLSQEDLQKSFGFLFGILRTPEKMFELQPSYSEKMDVEGIEHILNLTDTSTKEILTRVVCSVTLNNFSLSSLVNVVSFVLNSLSDLIYEVMVGNGKTLSIKADMFLEKLIRKDNDETMDVIQNITILSALLKLYKRCENKTNVLTLFNYFILLLTKEDEMTFPKMKLDSLTNQLKLFGRIGPKVTMYVLLFIKEFLIKNYKEKQNVKYFIELLMSEKLTWDYGVNRILAIEIMAIMIKIHPREIYGSLCKFLPLSEKYTLLNMQQTIDHFCDVLTRMKDFNNFVKFSLFDNDTKKIIANATGTQYENDEFDTKYDNELIHQLFNFFLNSTICSVESILNIITTYELISLNEGDNSNRILLQIDNNENMTNVSNYFETSQDITPLYTAEVYLRYYSDILLLSLIKSEKRFSIKLLEGIVFQLNSIEEETFPNNLFPCLFQEIRTSNENHSNRIFSLLGLVQSLIQSESFTCDDVIIHQLLKVLFTDKLLNHPITYSIIMLSYNKIFQVDKEKFQQYISCDVETLIYEKYSIFFTNNTSYKKDYLNFIDVFYFNSQANRVDGITMSPLVNEIFSIMDTILNIEFDFRNDKKYSINYEILVSKIEILHDKDEHRNGLLHLIVFNFILGNYWILFTKTVWVVLSKCMERVLQYIMDKFSSENNIFNHIAIIFTNIALLIQTFPSEDEVLYKFGKAKLGEIFLTFKQDTSLHIPSMRNLILINFHIKNKFLSVAPFFNGLLLSLQTYHILLKNQTTRDHYFTIFLQLLKLNSGVLNVLNSNCNSVDCPDDIFYLSLYNNFIMDKEHKANNTLKKLIETLLFVTSRTPIEDKFKTETEHLVKKQIIISKSIQIQKYCVEILIKLNKSIAQHSGLLVSVIENSNVSERLANLEKIANDNGTSITYEERQVLIPIVIRLYYSKYFYITNDNKKMKTKNKINLVSFFIQLSEKEFDEYVEIIFDPVENVKELGLKNFDLKTYKKIIEILMVNFKQITSLFKNSISTTTNLLQNIFVFLKRLNDKIKIEEGAFIATTDQVLKKYNLHLDKYYSYFNQEGFGAYINFFMKNLKEIKKQSFSLFTIIFARFPHERVMIEGVSDGIITEYKGILLKESEHTPPKLNSMYKFFISFARNPNLHFIYTRTKYLFDGILNVISHPKVEKVFWVRIVEFLENLLVPYYDFKLENVGNNDVMIEELDLRGDEDKIQIDMDDEMLRQMEKELIIKNFFRINDSVLSLVRNEKIYFSIKDNITKRILEILLHLWGLYDSCAFEYKQSVHSAVELIGFLTKLLKTDHKIFKQSNRETLEHILKISHILVVIVIRSGANGEFIGKLYKDFLHLLYRVENTHSRLILSILLQEFAQDETSRRILQLVIELNSIKMEKRSLENQNEGNIDIDTIISKLDLVDSTLQVDNLSQLEPLLYQLLVLSKHQDYALQSISIDKLKFLIETFHHKDTNGEFKHILHIFYNLVKFNFSYAKPVMEILSLINTNKLFPSCAEIICEDVFKLDVNKDFNFFEAVLHLKYELRMEALNCLKENLSSITQHSLKHLIIPMVKHFLTPNTYVTIQVKNKRDFSIQRSDWTMKNMVKSAISLVGVLCSSLSNADLIEMIWHFQRQIEKVNKKSDENDSNYLIDVTDMTYKVMTEIISFVTQLRQDTYNFNHLFAETMRDLTTKEKDKDSGKLNVRELIKLGFENMVKMYKTQMTHDDEIFRLIKSTIYRTIKSVLFRQDKSTTKMYYVRNFAIEPFLNILKLIEPSQAKYELIQLNYELINNLKNRDLGVREKAREGISMVINSIGPYTICMLLEEIKTQLHSGYQRHIMGYTCNFIINSITEPEIDVANVLEYSTDIITPILLEELFGEVAEEKEIEMITNKYKEAKKMKAFHSFFILGAKVNVRNLIENVVNPMREYLSKRDNDLTVINRANEAINHIVKGLKNNSNLKIDEVLNYAYGLIKIGSDFNLKNSKEIKNLKKVEIKGGNFDMLLNKEELNNGLLIQVGSSNGKTYSIQIANKFLSEKNEIILSNLFTSFGLDFMLISIKKKILFEKMDEIKESLSLIVQEIILCLKISNNNILAKSLKILVRLFDEKLFIIKKNIRKIIGTLFKNLNMINSKDVTLAQSTLSAIGDILTKYTFCEVKDSQFKILLNFLKLNMSNGQIKPYVFSCLLSVIKRKILHPSVYDMIEYIKETYLTSSEENTLVLCQNILIEFLTNYPLDEKVVTTNINFFLINLDSNTRRCVMNSLRMISQLLTRYDKLKDMTDFIILKLLTLQANTNDPDVKQLVSLNLTKLFNLIDEKKFEGYMDKAVEWLGGEEEGMDGIALNLLSEMTNQVYSNVQLKLQVILNTLKLRIGTEVRKFEDGLQEKIQNEDYSRVMNNKKRLDNVKRLTQVMENEEGESMNVLEMKFDDWNVLYLLLVIFEKIMLNYTIPKLDVEMVDVVIKSLSHPHLFIKSISMRLIGNFLERKVIKLRHVLNEEQTADFLLRNFKFVFLNSDFKPEDKLTENVLTNSYLLLEQMFQMDNFMPGYEFICRLYVESKSYISNKEVSGIVFGKIFNLFDLLVEKLSSDTLGRIIEPMLSLFYRITTNANADPYLKERANSLIENMNGKVEKELLTKKHKDVREEINLLKKKRKMDLAENFHTNHQEYVKQKRKLKNK